MSKAISTAGMTPFRVSIAPTVPGMVKFVRAMTRTGAKVSSSQRGVKASDALSFIVWLNPMYIAMFESFCEPEGFQFIASEALKVDGSLDPTKLPA